MSSEDLDYNLEDIKISGEHPGKIIELDGIRYQVEVDLTREASTKVAKTSAWKCVDGEVYEVKNYSKLAKLHNIFMEKYSGDSDE